MVEDKLKGKDELLSKRSGVSKQVLLIWRDAVSADSASVQNIVCLCITLVIHVALIALPSWIKFSTNRSMNNQQPVKITLAPIEQKSAPSNKETHPTKSHTSPPGRVKKQILTVKPTENPLGPLLPQVPQIPSSPTDLSAAQQPKESSLLEERYSPLLPAGNKDFIERQRKLGDAIGAGAIAGDLEIPNIMSEQESKSAIRKTEYTFAGYFDSLSRRFVEAWGGVRTLPPQARFDGKLGEFIEYDVVINRDGSLRKVINVSAKREPYRNFSAVDELVIGVFKSMFPFQPVPDRIHNDPLVIRKRIQFVGFKYTIY